MENDPKNTFKWVVMGLRDNKGKVLEWLYKALTSILQEISGQQCKSMFQQSDPEATQNVWYK